MAEQNRLAGDINFNHLSLSEKTRTPPSTSDDGPPHLNATTKNGSTKYQNGKRAKSAGIFGRITKNVLFRIFLLLLILALLIPILVLAALIYKQQGLYSRDQSSDEVANSRMVGGSNANPGATNTVAGEEPGVPNAKNKDEYKQQMEEIYKKEPWRRDPTSAWKQLGASLTESVDPTEDACKDFFAYSCNQWKDRNPLDGEKEISNRKIMYDNVKV